MNYRLQDFIRYIIPGLYVLALISGWYILFRNIQFDTTRLSDLSGIIIILIPFVGFVVGYFIESMMALIEHLYYRLGGGRPSKNILKGSKYYPVKERDKILKNENIKGEDLTDIIAGQILQRAKQTINSERTEVFRENSILARNIFGGQLIATIFIMFIDSQFYYNGFWYISIIASCLFLWYWVHHNHVYVKYTFAEYAKIISGNSIE